MPAAAQEKIMFLDEGTYQTDNGRLSYFEDGGIVSNQLFMDANGRKLGNTPNYILQIDDNRLAISVNVSNVIQFIDTKGKAIAAIEGVPNSRCMVSDGKSLYVTSYAHEVEVNGSIRTFTRGFVAKIDLTNYSITDAVEVGYEPEGIALYDGHLFVANSGGYSYAEDHDYEHTVSVVDAATMKVTRTVNVSAINLYGYMSISGQYLCINSPGDYYEEGPSTVIFDCRAAIDSKPDGQCSAKLSFPSTYNTVMPDGNFLTIGSTYSSLTGDFSYSKSIINPAEVMRTGGSGGVSNTLPGSVAADIAGMQTPNSIYVNPYTGYIYATDARDSTSAGRLYQWTPEGNLKGTYTTYINPGHILALPPDGHFGGIDGVAPDAGAEPYEDSIIYNLQGIPVVNTVPGQIYIRGGRKFIQR